MINVNRKILPVLTAELKKLARGTAAGFLLGTIAALVLPSMFVLYLLFLQRLNSTFFGLARRPLLWPFLDAVIRPQYFQLLLFLTLALLLALNSERILRFLHRCYMAVATGTTLLWTLAAYICWTDPSWVIRVFTLTAAILLNIAVASVRISSEAGSNPLLSADRPAKKRK